MIKQQRTTLAGATLQTKTLIRNLTKGHNSMDSAFACSRTVHAIPACLDSIVHHPLHGYQRPHLLSKGVMTGGRLGDHPVSYKRACV